MKNKIKIILTGICFAMALPCSSLAAAGDVSAYEDVLQEYIQAAESHFDYQVLQNLQYMNEGARNFSGYDEFIVYYCYMDLNEDGTEELLFSVEEPENLPGSLIDVFTVHDRSSVQRLIGSDASTGYRSRYYVTMENRIKNVGSGGALNSFVTYYSFLSSENGLITEEQYTYDGWNGDVYTCINPSGNSSSISAEEFRSYYQDEDVNYEIGWQVLYDSRGGNKEESKDNGVVSAYQGIFVKDNIFLSLPLYSYYEPEEAIGIVYRVEEPEWDSNGCIKADILETVGEIYEKNSGYEIFGMEICSLKYASGEIVIEGDSSYAGTYIQVSNDGANMDLADVWLNLPEEAEKEEKSDIDSEFVVDNESVNKDVIVEKYLEFLQENYGDVHYAIVNAGEDGAPILIVTEASDHTLSDVHMGYAIYAYTFLNGQVKGIDGGSQITQRMSSGPWYFYNNKLYSMEGRGGYFRMDIYGDTYDRVFIDGNVPSEIFNDANILQLSRNTSDGAYTSNEAYESEYETSQDVDSSEYIFSDSAERYLTEAEVRNLSLQELNYARNEIYARRGRKFDSAELQNYFNSKSWYDPRIEAEDFSEDCFNDYEWENLKLLVKMENSLK